MKLDPRLKAIADYVEKGDRVADIGTDHGYIPIYLVETGKCTKVFATDVNRGPLKNARRIVKEQGFESFIELRLGNGLGPVLEEKLDKVIISGMGGLLIRDILSEGERLAEQEQVRFVLQPMVAQTELRQWLSEKGYRILSERLARDNRKFYEILLVEKGHEEIMDPLHYEIGKKLIEEKDPLLQDFINHKIEKYETILKNVETHSKDLDFRSEKLVQIKKHIASLREVLDQL